MSYEFPRAPAPLPTYQVFRRPPVAIRSLSGDIPEATCAAQRDIARTNGLLLGLGLGAVVGLFALMSGAVLGSAYADEAREHYR